MLYLWSLSVGVLPRKYSFKNMLWSVLITTFWLDGDLVYGSGSDHTYRRSWHLLGDSSLPLDHSVPGCSGSDLLLTLSLLWCRLQTQELWASWRSAESCWLPPPSASPSPPCSPGRLQEISSCPTCPRFCSWTVSVLDLSIKWDCAISQLTLFLFAFKIYLETLSQIRH